MKKLIGLITVVMGITTATAQEHTEGVIVYQVKLNPDASSGAPGQSRVLRSPGGGPPGAHGGPAADQAASMALFFRGEESLYKPVEEKEDEDFRFSSGKRVMRVGRLHNETYINTGTGEQLKSVELGKRYLIESSLEEIPWKLSEDTATILGYPCKRAHYHSMETGRDITAWYTEKLRVPAGPAGYHSLPGMILELEAGDGAMIIKALSVDLRPLENSELKRPEKGKAVTEKEFEMIRKEQMKRMREQQGNGMPGKPVIMRESLAPWQ